MSGYETIQTMIAFGMFTVKHPCLSKFQGLYLGRYAILFGTVKLNDGGDFKKGGGAYGDKY
ncbi:putative holin-like toxin [Enterococcus mundtii]|uniref:putative holin-like toxin n=1 Tax=Enterococcus mundtii TaxID=53346 RepID=UPI003971086E